jgi:hypothetical protein
LLLACLAAGCAPSLPPSNAPSAAGPTAESAATPESEPGAVECKLRCEAPRLIPRVAPEPDYTQREIDNATSVLSSMTGDFLACYKKRLRVNPNAHGFITIDILVTSDGHVRKVDTTGGAILGDQTMACIVHRVEQGVCEPPHGGGNIHVQVPFSLQVVGPDDET